MLPASLRWLGQNLGTLLLAFVLAVVVWVSAVLSKDPYQTRVLPRQVPLAQIGKDDSLMIVGDIPNQVRVEINAPESIHTQLIQSSGSVETWIDLSGYGPGTHNVPVQVRIDPALERISRVTQVEPATVEVEMERLTSVKIPVEVTIVGEPPQGYKRGELVVEPQNVTISGPDSKVSQVVKAEVQLDISNARESREYSLSVDPVDANGNIVTGVTATPRVVDVTQNVTLEGGYKPVVVRVVTTGNVASGYRLSNISVSPPIVTVFAANPTALNTLPGYVETRPVSLSGLTDDIEVRKELNLPSGISLVGEQSVLVQVSVAAIEGSLKIAIPVEAVGLTPDLEAEISPDTVDVIIEGPLPVLDKLDQSSFRVLVDLAGLEPGVYQISPVIDLIPDNVSIQSILPETVEVTIAVKPTPTPTAQAAANITISESKPSPTPMP